MVYAVLVRASAHDIVVRSSVKVYHTSFHDILDDIDQRYQALEGQIDDRLAALRRALSQSQGVQENLDMLLRWLDKAERDCYNMEKGTLISLQKEPLLENMESQQVRMFPLCELLMFSLCLYFRKHFGFRSHVHWTGP